MEKYLTYEDESSKKFWQVRTDGSQVTVTFGRIGTAGQAQAKEYASSTEAEKEAEKQAASKIKKGYTESAPPADVPTPKAPAAVKAPAPKAAPAKKASKTEAGPAPVMDDGQPKPWHDSSNWNYPWYCGNETAFVHLDKPLDTPPTDDGGLAEQRREQKAAALKNTLSIPEGIVFNEDDDDSDREEKILLFLPPAEAIARLRITRRNIYMHPERLTEQEVENAVRNYIAGKLSDDCQWSGNHQKCLKWMDILRALIPDEGKYQAQIASCLSDGMEDALGTYGSVNEDDTAHIQWLLEQGAPIVKPLSAGDDDDYEDEDAPRPGEYKIRCDYIRHFVSEYKKDPDPARVPAIFAAYREDFYKKHAGDYAKGFLRMLTYIATGEDSDPESADTLKVPENACGVTHFALELDDIDAKPGGTWYKFGFTSDGIHGREGSVELQKHLAPLLQKMATEGAFDKIKSGLLHHGLFVLHVECNLGAGKPFFHFVLDEVATKAQADSLNALITTLEDRFDKGDFAVAVKASNQTAVSEESLKLAASALMDELYLPRDLQRFRRLMDKYTFNLQDADLAECAHQLIGTYNYHAPALQHDWSAHSLLNHNAQWSRESLEQSLSGWDDMPDMKARMAAYAQERAAQEERNGAGGKKVKKASRSLDSFAENFTEADVFLNTENVIARAYKEGSMYIRFKIEGEAGYAEVLDWLNALLEKQYANLNNGYSIFVRFLIEPVFIKQLENAANDDEGYGFPKTSCHAFFARAVQYLALREKVKRYAENALNKYDWYTDLDGEENTVTGTFAALALAFCEEQYIPLAGLYGRESDDEHQYIQLMVTRPLFKRWGATTEVACALFDIAASNGQDGTIYLPQALLQSTACLKAIVAHCESGPWAGDNFLKYCVPRFVEGIWSEEAKKNLKRLAIMRNEATAVEDKNTIAEFYNFYKRYAAELHGEDYGKDMHFEGESPADIVIPEYHENPPLLLSRQEAKAAGWEWDDTWYDDKRGILVHPASVDSLELYDYLMTQWNLGCKNYKNLDMSRFWGAGCCRVGEYVFNTKGMKYSYAIVLTDVKNKPFVLYGLLNAVPLIMRWCKRPFKTAEEAYAARTAALIRESPEKPAFSEADLLLEKRLEVAMSALNNDQIWVAGQIAKEFTPEQRRFYDAALVVRTQVAKKAKYDALVRDLTEELDSRRE